MPGRIIGADSAWADEGQISSMVHFPERRGCVPAAPVRASMSSDDARFDSTSFLTRHLVYPMLACTVLLAMVGLGHLDTWLADRIFALGGYQWAWRDAYLTEDVLHVFGRNASIALWLVTFMVWLAALKRPAMSALRRPLAYLFLAILLSTLLVGFLKAWSNMDCPWDLVRYGGERPYVGFFELRPAGLDRGRCFPAGHASGGYAWLSLYFFLAVARPRWRWAGLACGLGLGLVFGVAQQLRGAHFLSHDISTAAICWLVSLVLFRMMWHEGVPMPASTSVAVLTAGGAR